MTTDVDRYAVFGNPIHHSKSPRLHQTFAEQTQQTIQYTAECIEPDLFEKAVTQFFEFGGKGLNITVPFKDKAFNYVKHLTNRAQHAGAVNTLYLDANDEIVGDNTDGVGLVQDITQLLGWEITHKNVLIVGAGGAVKGIIEPLIAEKPASITIVNRTVEKAIAIADSFQDHFSINAHAFSDIQDLSFDIIINGTSASLAGELPPLNPCCIQQQTACYDMMYAKELTPFLQWAKQHGCKRYSDGLGMLVCQGAESFYQWRKVHPDPKAALAALRKKL